MAIADHYRRDVVMTARPDQLVTMLYDRLLQAIVRARELMSSEGDLSTVHAELVLGQRILVELQVTLDTDRGGDLATNLAQLYEFCIDKLVAANLSKSADELEDAENVVRDIRDAWVTAANEIHAG
ncbi:MAG: flagellar export chaperone FliS [Actinomycetota bacterium]|jgi:flagellar secretion chaperone FliS|nr:flagellar export chaperone FliS [Actinomycetota bacterium]